LLAFFRPFMFRTMSAYVALCFDVGNFGKLWGFVLFTSGLVNLASYGAESLIYNVLHGDFLPANIFQTAISAALFIFPYWFCRHFVGHDKTARTKAEETAHTSPGDQTKAAVAAESYLSGQATPVNTHTASQPPLINDQWLVSGRVPSPLSGQNLDDFMNEHVGAAGLPIASSGIDVADQYQQVPILKRPSHRARNDAQQSLP